jgi:Heterokaryon incompatibility protein (HET)
MWLLNTSSLELKDFVGTGIKPYAILSHTWGEEEVTFRDMRKYREDEAVKKKAGYAKVLRCCAKAQEDGFSYVWIDTCCIDKRSSAELSEAINSMFRWYQESQVCYAYLEDVPSGTSVSDSGDYNILAKSRWFTRGWTLQELIAPKRIQFLRQDWTVIGVKEPKSELARQTTSFKENHAIFISKLAEITGIAEKVLLDDLDIRLVPAAQKMAWAAKRQTTREEDLSYGLMGLFGVTMPILYGEGLKKAFHKLQLEIIQMTTDQSVFVWRADREMSGLLADSPRDFAKSGLDFVWRSPTLQPYSMTNLGLCLNLPIIENPDNDNYLVFLRCCG